MIKLYSEKFDVALYRFKERVAEAVNYKTSYAPVKAFSVYNPDHWVETKNCIVEVAGVDAERQREHQAPQGS